MFTSVEPSAATVHRAVEFNGSNLSVPVSSKTKSTPDGVLFIFVISVHFRYHFSDAEKGCLESKLFNISFARFDIEDLTIIIGIIEKTIN